MANSGAAGACILTELGVKAHNPAAPADERYLLYQPQFDLSKQALTLRNGLAWASLLNRTLVLPHLVGRTLAHAAFGSAYDLDHARAAVAPVQLAEMDEFVELGMLPERMLELETGILLDANTNAYLENVPLMPTVPPHPVPLATFTAATIQGAFGGCEAHRVLMFRSLFGAFSHEPGAPSPEGWFVGGEPGLSWLDTKAMPALLTPAPPVAKIVSKVVALLSGDSGSRTLGCVHVRRGDFVDECMEYLKEAATQGSRSWPRDHLRRGYSCVQSHAELALNVRHARAVHLRAHLVPKKLVVPDCLEYYDGVDFSGHDCRCMGRDGSGLEASGLPTPAHCGALCGPLLAARPLEPPVDGVGYFTWREFDGACWCKSSSEGRAAKPGFSSGRACRLPPPPPPPPPPPSPPPLPPLLLYAATEASPEEPAAMRDLNLTSLRDVDDGVDEALHSEAKLPREVGRELVDQLVCARASTLLLNAYSDFSQLVLARIGMHHAPRIGWVHELSFEQQKAAGVRLAYLRRIDRFDPSRLLL